MTEQERLKTDTVFVDTVIRECALMTIQKEADAQRIAELEERLDAVSAIPPAEPSAALQRQLDKAVADLHFVMAGGDAMAWRGRWRIMTLKELSQLYYLNREIEMDKRRLQELEAQAVSCTPNLTGMPHAPGVSDKVGRYAAEIVDLRGIIEAKHQQCLYERSRLERYISDIEDSYLRLAFTYRFINGLPWEQVAACIGGSNTADGVRMMCNRYIKATNDDTEQ